MVQDGSCLSRHIACHIIAGGDCQKIVPRFFCVTMAFHANPQDNFGPRDRPALIPATVWPQPPVAFGLQSQTGETHFGMSRVSRRNRTPNERSAWKGGTSPENNRENGENISGRLRIAAGHDILPGEDVRLRLEIVGSVLKPFGFTNEARNESIPLQITQEYLSVSHDSPLSDGGFGLRADL